MMEDQSSDCESLEVIDMDEEISEAIADAAKDETALKKLEEERSKSKEKIPEALTTSQYAQVIFHEVMDCYTNTSDVTCRYTITDGFRVANADRIGLYRLPFLQPQEYIMYSWVQSLSDGGEGTVVFPAKDLPQEADFYQFQYIKYDGTVAGASLPWHLNAAESRRAEAVAGVGGEEAEDLVMVETPLSSLRNCNEVLGERVKDIEQKYNRLLETSEKLCKELSEKNDSIVVLESRCRALCEEEARTEELKGDIQNLIAEKLALEQNLHKANEEKRMAEAEVQEMASRVKSLQEVLDINSKEQQVCEHNRAAAEQEVKQLHEQMEQMEQELVQLHDERATINTMLDTELTKRASCLSDNQHLMARLEDANSMLQETQKSKAKAIAEIHSMVGEQDRLRREIQQHRDTIESLQMSKSLLEEEFVRTKDQLLELTRAAELTPPDQEQIRDPAVQEVLASLGSKLEKAEQTIRDQEQQIKALKPALETANQALEKQSDMEYVNWLKNSQLKETMDEMTAKMDSVKKEHEKQLTTLQEENLNLKQRLQVGAELYKKLAQEKERPVSCQCESYQHKITDLSGEVKALRSELLESRRESRLSFTELKEVVSGSEMQSIASASSSAYSGDSNLDSFRIRSQMETGARPRHPAIAQPGGARMAFAQATIAQLADAERAAVPPSFWAQAADLPVFAQPNSEVTVKSGSLPQPLQPENLGPSAPKVVPAAHEPPQVHDCGGAASPSLKQLRECPVCDQQFAETTDAREIADHVDSHFGKECPFCFKDCVTVEALEAHVQTHQAPEPMMSWELGID